MSNSLIVPPLELRLGMYRHIVIDATAEDKISDIGGLLFSCREVFEEMMAEYVS
jgi:hypothetical protein